MHRKSNASEPLTMGQLADYAAPASQAPMKPAHIAKPKNPNWRPEHNLGKFAHKPKGR